MPLNPPRGGLRPIHYNANSVGKVDVRVQPGEELHVSDGLAAQLQASDSHFRDGPAPSAVLETLVPEPEVVVVGAGLEVEETKPAKAKAPASKK